MIENGVGEWPEELVDSELCQVYSWTWQELQDTPLYVRRVFAQIQSMKNEKQNQDADASQAAARHPGAEVVRRG